MNLPYEAKVKNRKIYSKRRKPKGNPGLAGFNLIFMSEIIGRMLAHFPIGKLV
jgi:hypothetical protein